MRTLRAAPAGAVLFGLAVLAAFGGLASAAAAAPRCTLVGTNRANVLVGTASRDVICGRGGNDVIRGKAGNDVVVGGLGADRVYGGPGADVVSGDRGTDRISGDSGPDTIVALDRARDVVLGGPGLDRARLDRRDRRAGIERVFGKDATLLAAGDIADCHRPGRQFASATAALLDQYPGALVAALGDNVYPSTASDSAVYETCYGPTWGRARARTRPAIGNHEYDVPISFYFGYFGAAAGPAGKGYYSYDLGSWHVVVLNSECVFVPCHAGSEQEAWLRADLARNPAVCTLAYWHTPRFSSGKNGTQDPVPSLAQADFWNALYAAGADVILNGHDHDYERFAPQSPAGTRDDARGIRAFVVGTGGAGLSDFFTILPTSEVRESRTYGVLRLALRAGGYDWKFLPAAGGTFTDSGSSDCR